MNSAMSQAGSVTGYAKQYQQQQREQQQQQQLVDEASVYDELLSALRRVPNGGLRAEALLEGLLSELVSRHCDLLCGAKHL